jgi:hypothetical protein
MLGSGPTRQVEMAVRVRVSPAVLPREHRTHGPRAFIRELGVRFAAGVTRLGRARGTKPAS